MSHLKPTKAFSTRVTPKITPVVPKNGKTFLNETNAIFKFNSKFDLTGDSSPKFANSLKHNRYENDILYNYNLDELDFLSSGGNLFFVTPYLPIDIHQAPLKASEDSKTN